VSHNSEAFDPDAPADADGGLFGLSPEPEEALVHVLGVPFDATTSYRKGTALGPAAVLRASHQVDLLDLQQRSWPGGDGRPWRAGIHFELDEEIAAWNAEVTPSAAEIIDRGGRIGEDAELVRALRAVDAAGERLNSRVETWTADRLRAGRIPVVLGGDHSVPFGAIRAAAAAHPGLGLLHFDAHADLRPAFEGFRWSHASIVHNLLEGVPTLGPVLSVGLRDLGEVELERIESEEGGVHAVFGHDWGRERSRGADLAGIAAREVERLPREVWISFDIDGLEPTWCPGTGTPVPGGLTWDEALLWIEALVASGRRIVGLDLCEVSPGEGEPSEEDAWDAVVGARLLYKLIGAALASRPS
jgi:agmatinase